MKLMKWSNKQPARKKRIHSISRLKFILLVVWSLFWFVTRIINYQRFIFPSKFRGKTNNKFHRWCYLKTFFKVFKFEWWFYNQRKVERNDHLPVPCIIIKMIMNRIIIDDIDIIEIFWFPIIIMKGKAMKTKVSWMKFLTKTTKKRSTTFFNNDNQWSLNDFVLLRRTVFSLKCQVKHENRKITIHW